MFEEINIEINSVSDNPLVFIEEQEIISAGQFHAEWMKEHNDGYSFLDKLRKEEKELSIEKISQYMLKELFGDK